MGKCTCLEVFGEDPRCSEHGVQAVIRRLREYPYSESPDPFLTDEAADLIEWLADKLDSKAGAA